MKKIGFIGAYDKTDMLLNIARILTELEKKVLVIDSSVMQKARYIVPAINPTVSYITSFEDIDVAIGFDSIEKLKNYIGNDDELPYDVVLVDADSIGMLEGYSLDSADNNYFVTAFDMYSLRRGVEILSGLKIPLELTRVFYTKNVSKEDEEYLDYLTNDCKIKWKEDKIYFPLENVDYDAILENQRVQKIKFKKLSFQYKDCLSLVSMQILGEDGDWNIRKAIKNIERGV